MNRLSYGHPDDKGRRAVMAPSGQSIGVLMPTVSPEVLRASPGIQSWSRGKDHVAIFSVYRADETEKRNRLAHDAELAVLKGRGIPCAEVEGCYNGEVERSILCIANTPGEQRVIRDIAQDWRQESLLYIEPGTNNAWLIYLDARAEDRVHIGTLRAVSERRAKRAESWTYVPNLDQYYIVD